MVDNLKKEVEYLKTSKQEKVKVILKVNTETMLNVVTPTHQSIDAEPLKLPIKKVILSAKKQTTIKFILNIFNVPH